MQPDAGGTRTAVEGIGDRSLRRIIAGIEARVSDVEDLRLLLRLVILAVFVFRLIGVFPWRRRGQRTSRSGLAVFGFFLLCPIAHHHETSGRAVADGLPADGERVLRHTRRRLFVVVFAFVLILPLAFSGRRVRRGLCLLTRWHFQFPRDRLARLRASE